MKFTLCVFKKSLFVNKTHTIKTLVLSNFITGGDLTLSWMNEWMVK